MARHESIYDEIGKHTTEFQYIVNTYSQSWRWHRSKSTKHSCVTK